MGVSLRGLIADDQPHELRIRIGSDSAPDFDDTYRIRLVAPADKATLIVTPRTLAQRELLRRIEGPAAIFVDGRLSRTANVEDLFAEARRVSSTERTEPARTAEPRAGTPRIAAEDDEHYYPFSCPNADYDACNAQRDQCMDNAQEGKIEEWRCDAMFDECMHGIIGNTYEVVSFLRLDADGWVCADIGPNYKYDRFNVVNLHEVYEDRLCNGVWYNDVLVRDYTRSDGHCYQRTFDHCFSPDVSGAPDPLCSDL